MSDTESVVKIRDVATAEDFDRFWKMCPKKQDKVLARSRFKLIVNGGYHAKIKDRETGQLFDAFLEATAEELIAGMKAYRDHVIRSDVEDKYIMGPSTWLNRGRWEDFS